VAQDQHDSTDALASSIGQRGLTAPAVLLLELLKPLSFVCSQALLMIDPLVSPLAGGWGRRWAWLLEDRQRIDGLIETLAAPRPPVLPSEGREDRCNH